MTVVARFGDESMLLQSVVLAEMDHWVAGSSQKLICRAAELLDHDLGLPMSAPDHGPNPGDHALCADWVCGVYVQRCVTCAHLFYA